MAKIIINGANIVKDAYCKEFNTQDGKKGWFFAVNIAEPLKMSKEEADKAKAEGKPTANYYSVSLNTYSEAQKNYYVNMFKTGNHMSLIGEYDGVAEPYQTKEGTYVSGSLRIKMEPRNGGELTLWAKSSGNATTPTPTAPTPVPTPQPQPVPQTVPQTAPQTAPAQQTTPAPQQSSDTAYQGGARMPWDEDQ